MKAIPAFNTNEIEVEAQRLFNKLMSVDCDPNMPKWTWDECLKKAPLTLAINRAKEDKEITLLAHSYVNPDIIYGVADYVGDSYYLARQAANLKAKNIVFAGVVFMAESAKILSPQSRVWVPDRKSGCSLADSITGAQLRALKAQYPNAAVVSYINCNADVKAESDVCVTSTNVYDIISALPQKEILFVPDKLMAENIRVEMRARGINKQIFSSDGTCMVHDQFTPDLIRDARIRFPGLKVVSHPECTLEITQESDFVGSTGAMMDYVKKTPAPYFMLLTECGLVTRLEVEHPEIHFIGSCRVCPYMKLNSLEKIYATIMEPTAAQEITLDEPLRLKAETALTRMLAMTK